MTSKVKWTDPPHFGTSTGQHAPSLVTTSEVEAIKEKLRANPQVDARGVMHAVQASGAFDERSPVAAESPGGATQTI